jgi:type II restriction enzyme
MSKIRVSFDLRLKQAARAFWLGREKAAEKQQASGRTDQGNRGKVTGGKALDSFRDMVIDVVKRNAPARAEIYRERALVGLPGYFRPTKLWDLLVMHEGRLLAVLELKSLCGPSFGNNANNRCEEALGSACDFRKAQNEGLFGAGAAPFLGYFILIEDAPGSQRSVKENSPHFPADPAFQNASYQKRMQLLCERMVQHQLYSSAAVLVSGSDQKTGTCTNLSPHTSFRNLLTRLGAHLLSESDAVSGQHIGKDPRAPYGGPTSFDEDYFEPTE